MAVLTNVKVNQGVTLDFFSLNDNAENKPLDIFVNNFKPTKSLSTVAMATFESDQRG